MREKLKIMQIQELLYKYGEGKRDFEHTLLRDRDLSWQYLKKINLSHGDLSISLLEGVDLTEAQLINTNLFRADLTVANLYKANLRGANLRGADLRGAELASANLRFADLRDVSLAGADLSNAILPNGAIMPDRAIIQRTKVISHLTKDTPVNRIRENSIYQYCQ